MLAQGLSAVETSISIYHEILEGLTVAVRCPPDAMLEMNEADFEKAARDAQKKFGVATRQNVLRFLEEYGFC